MIDRTFRDGEHRVEVVVAAGPFRGLHVADSVDERVDVVDLRLQFALGVV